MTHLLWASVPLPIEWMDWSRWQIFKPNFLELWGFFDMLQDHYIVWHGRKRQDFSRFISKLVKRPPTLSLLYIKSLHKFVLGEKRNLLLKNVWKQLVISETYSSSKVPSFDVVTKALLASVSGSHSGQYGVLGHHRFPQLFSLLQPIGYRKSCMALYDHFLSSFLRIHAGSKYRLWRKKILLYSYSISANLYTFIICLCVCISV